VIYRPKCSLGRPGMQFRELFVTRDISTLMGETYSKGEELTRSIGAFGLMVLGVGAIIGTGDLLALGALIAIKSPYESLSRHRRSRKIVSSRRTSASLISNACSIEGGPNAGSTRSPTTRFGTTRFGTHCDAC
jgi:hypothetical protein